MNQPALTITSATQKVDPALAEFLTTLKPGDRIRVKQTVRVGARTWTATTAGSFRYVDYLATGLSTERVPEDDIIVPQVHFTKDNGELSSVTIDEPRHRHGWRTLELVDRRIAEDVEHLRGVRRDLRLENQRPGIHSIHRRTTP